MTLKNTNGALSLNNALNADSIDPNAQTMNFGQTADNNRFANSFNDRSVENIFQTGALYNTGNISELA